MDADLVRPSFVSLYSGAGGVDYGFTNAGCHCLDAKAPGVVAGAGSLLRVAAARRRLVSPPASSPAARAVMQGNRSSDTRPEARLRSELHRRGLRFRKGVAPADVRCRVDVLFTRARLAVLVDGCFWHGCPQHGTSPRTNSAYWTEKLAGNRARDKRNDEALTAAGWRVLRVWEHEDAVDAANRVESALDETGGR